ncbi:MAG: hypothetical protein LBD04_03870 [Synergistaceae bacterium]|jgi:hypothetical protein|nr:hypothetical protein [Synergistaceae bacterium]
MERYDVLLGVHPAASADEIEEAYQNRKREIAPERFTPDSEEHRRALLAMRELDRAYDEALMTTFTPIRAGLPKATQSRPPASGGALQPPITPASSPAAAPQPPIQPSPPPYESFVSVRSSYAPPSNPAAAKELKGLVGETFVSFSDAQLLNMDIGTLRESQMTSGEGAGVLAFGIEDPLLRFYVRAYLGFAFFDLLMTLLLGVAWRGMSSRYVSFIMETMPNLPLPQALAESQPSLPIVVATPFISMLYLFFCSLPMPIATRFFIMGQPAGNEAARWLLVFISVAAAHAIYAMTGFLFRLLPPAWAGSSASLFFVAPTLCLVTVRYQGE